MSEVKNDETPTMPTERTLQSKKDFWGTLSCELAEIGAFANLRVIPKHTEAASDGCVFREDADFAEHLKNQMPYLPVKASGP